MIGHTSAVVAARKLLPFRHVPAPPPTSAKRNVQLAALVGLPTRSNANKCQAKLPDPPNLSSDRVVFTAISLWAICVTEGHPQRTCVRAAKLLVHSHITPCGLSSCQLHTVFPLSSLGFRTTRLILCQILSTPLAETVMGNALVFGLVSCLMTMFVHYSTASNLSGQYLPPGDTPFRYCNESSGTDILSVESVELWPKPLHM